MRQVSFILYRKLAIAAAGGREVGHGASSTAASECERNISRWLEKGFRLLFAAASSA